MRSLLISAALLTACQSGESKSPDPRPAPEVDPPALAPQEPGLPPSLAIADEEAYRGDISRLCDVMALSGADQLDEGSRMFTVAQWLGSNLVTEVGHDFLVTMQLENDGRRKGEILRGEASRLGLPTCKLAESWN